MGIKRHYLNYNQSIAIIDQGQTAFSLRRKGYSLLLIFQELLKIEDYFLARIQNLKKILLFYYERNNYTLLTNIHNVLLI